MLWFTNIYAIVVAGVLAFMSQNHGQLPISVSNSNLFILLSAFLLSFSVLGFMVVMSQSLGFKNHIMNVLVIMNCWQITGFQKDPEKPIHFKKVYELFYRTAILIFTAFLAFYLFKNLACVIVLAFISIIVVEAAYRCICKSEFEKRDDFIKALRMIQGNVFQQNWDEQFGDKTSELWKNIQFVAAAERVKLPKEILLPREPHLICRELRKIISHVIHFPR